MKGAHIYAKLGKSKSDKTHEAFATRDMMVGTSLANTPGPAESLAMRCKHRYVSR